ncbi:isopentenyl-diphosphate Delta-isomerase [Spinactinospora alkalitolerans]
MLLDEEHRPVGSAAKSTVHHGSTPLHLAFSCYVFDPEGRLLVTRRALAKQAWPGVWTNSCCGHPGPGEAVEEALVRRVREELGIGVRDVRAALPDYAYRAVDAGGTVENEFCPVYLATTTERPSPDPAEVMEWRWVDWAGFCAAAARAPWAISPWAAEQTARLAAEGVRP